MAYYSDQCLDGNCQSCKDTLCYHDCHMVELEIKGTVDSKTGSITFNDQEVA